MIALLLISSALKALANELNVFVWSSTQLNGTEEEGKFATQAQIRGAKAISDKADIGCVARGATQNVLKPIGFLINNGHHNGLIPNVYIDFYKNRRGKLVRVRLWRYFDAGTCRAKDLFLTNEYDESIDTTILRAKTSIPEFSYELFDLLSSNTEKPSLNIDLL
jgi:replicative DNA helicase